VFESHFEKNLESLGVLGVAGGFSPTRILSMMWMNVKSPPDEMASDG
jgi:hypothetical protein